MFSAVLRLRRHLWLMRRTIMRGSNRDIGTLLQVFVETTPRLRRTAPNIARALGTESFDGKGNLTGSAIANQPWHRIALARSAVSVLLEITQ